MEFGWLSEEQATIEGATIDSTKAKQGRVFILFRANEGAVDGQLGPQDFR
jgi:hypothetical protein